MSAIINSGRAYISAKIAESNIVDISHFVLAYIPGINHTDAVNMYEVMPEVENIVIELPVTRKSYVTTAQVVYSLMMGTNIGPFYFNWIGLKASTGELIAVQYVSTLQKIKTEGGVLGNNHTRNFMLKFDNAQSVTGITLPAESWQMDFTGRLNDQDALVQQQNIDLYGTSHFISNSFNVVNETGVYKIKPGFAYVHGMRIALANDMVIAPPSMPTSVWLDVYHISTEVNAESQWSVLFSTVIPNNYVDSAGTQHYFVKISDIVTTTPTDIRRVIDWDELSDNGLLSWINTQLRLAISENDRQDSEMRTHYSSVRNTVLTGRVDAEGKANFLELHEGDPLRVDINTSIQLCFSAGFDQHGEINHRRQLTTATFPDPGILGANDERFFLYLKLDIVTNTVTQHMHRKAPVYSHKLPAGETGKYWYPTDHRSQGKAWNGSAWVDELRVYVGEIFIPYVVGEAPEITEIVSYAYQGKSTVEMPGSDTSLYQPQHNIGCKDNIKTRIYARFNEDTDDYDEGDLIEITHAASFVLDVDKYIESTTLTGPSQQLAGNFIYHKSNVQSAITIKCIHAYTGFASGSPFYLTVFQHVDKTGVQCDCNITSVDLIFESSRSF